MRDGFTLCILLQIQAIEFEIDANFVIVFLTNYEASYAPIIDDYKNLMNWIPHWKFNHCYKEANSCTDTFAKMTVHLQQDFVILDTPPMELFPHLLYDLFGLGCNWLCYYGGIVFSIYIYISLLPKKKKNTNKRISALFHVIRSSIKYNRNFKFLLDKLSRGIYFWRKGLINNGQGQ